jgi:uncharacterized protein Veg
VLVNFCPDYFTQSGRKRTTHKQGRLNETSLFVIGVENADEMLYKHQSTEPPVIFVP